MNISEFKGFGSPLTARGQASPYGPEAWHMAGRVFTVWFRAPAGEIEKHVPAPLTVPRDALCRVRFYELLHNAGFDDGLSAKDPPRGSFHEAVLAVPVSYRDEIGDYSVHLYTEDADYLCWAREVPGWPVKMGNIVISKPWPGMPLERGTTITASLERHGRRLITTSVQLTEHVPLSDYPKKAAERRCANSWRFVLLCRISPDSGRRRQL
jgi:Acetoacetate decarboxylase (ADC)